MSLAALVVLLHAARLSASAHGGSPHCSPQWCEPTTSAPEMVEVSAAVVSLINATNLDQSFTFRIPFTCPSSFTVDDVVHAAGRAGHRIRILAGDRALEGCEVVQISGPEAPHTLTTLAPVAQDVMAVMLDAESEFIRYVGSDILHLERTLSIIANLDNAVDRWRQPHLDSSPSRGFLEFLEHLDVEFGIILCPDWSDWVHSDPTQQPTEAWTFDGVCRAVWQENPVALSWLYRRCSVMSTGAPTFGYTSGRVPRMRTARMFMDVYEGLLRDYPVQMAAAETATDDIATAAEE